MMNWCHKRHPSVSVHPTSRLSDILTHMQTRGRLGALWKLLVLSYNGRLGAQLLRPGGEQAHSDVAGAWVQILDGKHSGRSHQC